MKKNNNILVSLHSHPGLESEINILANELDADLLISNGYKTLKRNFKRVNFFTLFRKNRCDFYIYNTSVLNFFIVIHKLIYRSKIHYHFHEPILSLSTDNDFLDNIKCLVVNIIHRLFFIFSDSLILFSQCGKKRVPEKYWHKTSIASLPFDKLSLTKHREKIGIKTSKQYSILFYGNINSGKNPEEFIGFFSQLKMENYSFTFLTTSRYYYNKYKIYAKHNIFIEFAEKLSDTDIINKIVMNDIILLPHKRCTQSGILERATYLGKPILFGHCVCFDEHIGKYGIRYGKSPKDLENKLIYLEDNYSLYQKECLNRHS